MPNPYETAQLARMKLLEENLRAAFESDEAFEVRRPNSRIGPDLVQVWSGRGAAAQLAGVLRSMFESTYYIRVWGGEWESCYVDTQAVDRLVTAVRKLTQVGPPVLRTFPMFAHLDSTDGVQHWRHVFPHEAGVRMCGRSQPIVPVYVTIAPDGTYHGWWDPKEARLSMIYDNPKSLDICFPNGIAAAEAMGDGVAVRLRIERRSEESHERP